MDDTGTLSSALGWDFTGVCMCVCVLQCTFVSNSYHLQLFFGRLHPGYCSPLFLGWPSTPHCSVWCETIKAQLSYRKVGQLRGVKLQNVYSELPPRMRR